MLELLRISVTGFKLLEDNFTLDLTARARVYQEDKLREIKEIDKRLYLLKSNAVVGGNSSGKSTVLSLVLKTLLFLQTGRWKYSPNEFNHDEIFLDVIFYLDSYLYQYKGVFKKIDLSKNNLDDKYSLIDDISLRKLKYDKTKGIKNLDLISKGDSLNDLFSMSLDDTSAIKKITTNQVLVDDFSNNSVFTFNDNIYRNSFFSSLNSCSKELLSSILRLLDDSIEYLECVDSDHVKFKRFNKKEEILSNLNLVSLLSSGTFRGIELYIRCINAIKYGKTIIVDEIEDCFQKNLVYNLLFLFNDSSINVSGAKLFFSTHYVEILDYLNRRDGIFITHKKNGYINIKNLYSDYNVRTELLKSKQFDNNVFNTAINYQQLVEVIRTLVNELQTHINNDD